MKTVSTVLSLAVLALAPVVRAQVVPSTAVGTREIMLGAAGASNRQLSDSSGAANLAFGYYFTPVGEGLIRQSISYSNPGAPGARQEWNGSTFLAYDFNFAPSGALRPYLGANFGGVYGDTVRDTWAAGIEGGAKFYVQTRTFVYAAVDYGWFFRHARNAFGNRFNDGQFTWSVGVGFNL